MHTLLVGEQTLLNSTSTTYGTSTTTTTTTVYYLRFLLPAAAPPCISRSLAVKIAPAVRTIERFGAFCDSVSSAYGRRNSGPTQSAFWFRLSHSWCCAAAAVSTNSSHLMYLYSSSLAVPWSKWRHAQRIASQAYTTIANDRIWSSDAEWASDSPRARDVENAGR